MTADEGWPPDDGWSDARPERAADSGSRPAPSGTVTAAAGPTGPRRSRLTPFRVTMAIALIGSLILLAYGLITRDDNQLRILTAGGYVVGIVLAILALSGAYAAYRRASGGQEARAFGYALLGGLAAVLAALAFAAASILALVQHD